MSRAGNRSAATWTLGLVLEPLSRPMRARHGIRARPTVFLSVPNQISRDA